MSETIGSQLKTEREILSDALLETVDEFEDTTGVIVTSVTISLKEVKSGGGALEEKTEINREIYIELNL